MTLEELKIEANKLGYALVERKSHVPHPTCKCSNYRWGLTRYQDENGYYYKCDSCGCRAKSARTVREAQINWYDFTREMFGRKEIKRRG